MSPLTSRSSLGIAGLVGLMMGAGFFGVPGSSAAGRAVLGVAVTIGTGGATANAPAQRVSPPDPPPTASPNERFTTLPVGAMLPSDLACAARVRPAAENRASNGVANQTLGVGATAGSPRVTGGFTGTTDELIQWTACKWGIDEDVVRAQIAKESWWRQDGRGDLTSDQSACAPSLRTTTATCPESVGLGQVRYQYNPAAFANDNAIRSSAYNLDYTYSVWRNCFDGGDGWLNTVERGQQYTPGDLWGCVGVWFSGRWHTPAAEGYINAVQNYKDTRIWEGPDFQGG